MGRSLCISDSRELNLAVRFLQFEDDVYVATSEPHGDIEATVTRGDIEATLQALRLIQLIVCGPRVIPAIAGGQLQSTDAAVLLIALCRVHTLGAPRCGRLIYYVWQRDLSPGTKCGKYDEAFRLYCTLCIVIRSPTKDRRALRHCATIVRVPFSAAHLQLKVSSPSSYNWQLGALHI